MSYLLLWACLFGSTPSKAQDLSARLQKIVKSSSIPASSLGLVVYDIDQGKSTLVFGQSEQKEMIPASVTKIATATAVLSRLGPSFKFTTTLASTGRLKNGVLNGDLILKGGGDAGFVSESMWLLVNDLTRAGVTKVDGDIVVDDTDFDAIREDASRDPERNDRAYDAPVGAMSFNWNSINIYVRPTDVGGPVQVFLDPIDNGYKVESKAKTVTKAGWNISVNRIGKRILVSGTIGVDHGEHAVYKNIDDPIDWSGRNLIFFLSQRGISVTGKIKAGKMPTSAKVLAKVDSKPVSQHVTDMMKFSNNYVAEMLTKDLAAQNGEKPATLEGGMKLVRATVESMGIDGKRFTLVNPSGLSRRNRLRPADLAQILIQARKNFPWFSEFLSALPLAGLDGSLKKRMKNSPAEGWVRAKTGQLSGVAALAGFAGRKDGSVRAFAFMFNGKYEQGETARHLFDALAEQLVQ